MMSTATVAAPPTARRAAPQLPRRAAAEHAPLRGAPRARRSCADERARSPASGRPGSCRRPGARGPPAWAKIDGYLGRFAVYPRLVRGPRRRHRARRRPRQGYLVAGLDARRTVVTCHDVDPAGAGRRADRRRAGSADRAAAVPDLARAHEAGRASSSRIRTQTKRDLVDVRRHRSRQDRSSIHPGSQSAVRARPGPRAALRAAVRPRVDGP